MTNLLKSEKQVLIASDNMIIKVVFVDKYNNPIEDDSRYSDENVLECLNLLAGLCKSMILPVKGDFLDIIDARVEVKNRYFEIKENQTIHIVFDIY
jgi:hypothetical protein